MFNPKPTVRIPFLPCLKPFIQSGRNMAFFAGAIFAILTIFTVLDKDVLLAEHVLTVIATLGKQLSFRCNWVTFLMLTFRFPLHSENVLEPIDILLYSRPGSRKAPSLISPLHTKVWEFSQTFCCLDFSFFSGLMIRGCYVFIPDEVGIWFIS